jgi:SAM-dependent methyltransferase
MTDHDEYFHYLQGRSRLAFAYRKFLLYPRISAALSGRVLDIGCGIGDMVRVRPNTVGVDVNPKLVQLCRSRGLDVVHMDPDMLPFPDASFDGAVLDNVLEHLERPQPLLDETRRVLRPGARFVIGVPGKLGYASDPDHKVFYDEASLQGCLEASGFRLVRFFHTPMKLAALSARLRIYGIYGVFEPRGK